VIAGSLLNADCVTSKYSIKLVELVESASTKDTEARGHVLGTVVGR